MAGATVRTMKLYRIFYALPTSEYRVQLRVAERRPHPARAPAAGSPGRGYLAAARRALGRAVIDLCNRACDLTAIEALAL